MVEKLIRLPSSLSFIYSGRARNSWLCSQRLGGAHLFESDQNRRRASKIAWSTDVECFQELAQPENTARTSCNVIWSLLNVGYRSVSGVQVFAQVVFVCLFLLVGIKPTKLYSASYWEGVNPMGVVKHGQRHKPRRAYQRQRHKPRTCQSMVNTLQDDRWDARRLRK